jgi:hypothetical protein
LSKTIQAEVIEKSRDINTDYVQWHDGVFEDTKTIGKLMGIDITNIFYPGFSSQGDGACFEGKYEYAKDSVKKLKDYAPQDKELHRIVEALYQVQKLNFYRITASVKHSGHYYHKRCTDIDVYADYKTHDDYADNATSETVSELLRDFMAWIYKTLSDEYDFLSSDEQIIESIESNEFHFLKDGKRFI